MFTGIVEEVGTVRSLAVRNGSAALAISCEEVIGDAHVGDSVNVNGCCLTVTVLTPGTGFAVDVMGETLARTGVGKLRPGDPVNLERALRAGARLGGHMVQGHVDATATVADVSDHGQWAVMRFDLPASIAPYVVEKGSIAVDGTSLTVMGADGEHFWVGLIPHTRAVTVLGRRRLGDVVNLEADVIAKYVERLLSRKVDSPYAMPPGEATTIHPPGGPSTTPSADASAPPNARVR